MIRHQQHRPVPRDQFAARHLDPRVVKPRERAHDVARQSIFLRRSHRWVSRRELSHPVRASAVRPPSAAPRTANSPVRRPALPIATSPLSFPTVNTLLLLAPAWIVFEVAQLVIGERYLGIKQIVRSADPRTLGLSEITAFFWSSAILTYWLWMGLLLAIPYARAATLGLLAVSAIGFSLRRGNRLKWTLVILTFEGALRIVFLIALCSIVWRRL